MGKKLLLIVDMNNGFAKKGALYSPRVEKLIAPIRDYAEKFKGMIIGFTDTHGLDCIEFETKDRKGYPVHCVIGTEECEIVDELKGVKGLITIPKNSTNGFHEEQFQNILRNNPDIETIEIVGCCTDICVYQLAVSLSTYFTMKNKKGVEVIVHRNMVDTFDIPNVHDADKLNEIFLGSMTSNGVVVK